MPEGEENPISSLFDNSADEAKHNESDGSGSSSSSFCSLSDSSGDDDFDEEIDADEFEHVVRSNSRWGDAPPDKMELCAEMMGGPMLEFEEMEGSFDGTRAYPPDPPLDAYVTAREFSPPRPPDYIKNFREQREVIHPLL